MDDRFFHFFLLSDVRMFVVPISSYRKREHARGRKRKRQGTDHKQQETAFQLINSQLILLMISCAE